MDPEILRLNQEEQRRWGRRLERVDTRVEHSLKEAGRPAD
jgi:hypothetical protein